MSKKRIAIVGSSFAGYNTALTLAKLLEGKHEIIVIDRSPEFMFLPSLVWHPFGYRNSDDISFDVRPIYKKMGIEFKETVIYGFDLKERIIYTPHEDIPYDYLVIATGTRANYSSVKGFVPGETAYSICSMYEADRTRDAWKKFLKNPGPIVIGASQWASYFFAAYEFLLNALYQLKENDLLEKAPIHFVTAEPYLTHFGIGGIHDDIQSCEKLFSRYNVKWHTNEEIHELKDHLVVLESGDRIESDFTMIVPQFVGVDAITTTRKLSDNHGLIHVTDEFRHINYPNIYAAGGAVHVPQKDDTTISCGVPRTRNSSEIMAKAVAYNLYSDLEGGARISVSTDRIYNYCKEDMDHLGIILFGKSAAGDHDLDFIAKGSQEKWANISIEQYIEASFDPDYLRI
jgi:sulfide:quinone oxidoreductase